VFYEIFVRSFADSDGDGIGDLKGLTAKLDYINDGRPETTQDLGATALWLMPIFASPSYHGYDITDYRQIDPLYGTMDDFRQFLQAAHRRGIKVILDLVVNHTSNQHPWFKQSASSPRSPYRNWYVWRDNNPGWKQPWGNDPVWHFLNGAYYYGVFWHGMPDLNFRHPPVREEIKRIADFWLQQGVDGFRLDAVRYLDADGPGDLQSDRPSTHAFWREFRQSTKQTSSSSVLVAEAWSGIESIGKYCRGEQFDLAFHFPLASAIHLAVSSMTAAPLWKVLRADAIPQSCWASFLSNHDLTRIISQFHGDIGMMRMAVALLLTLPGTPFIYYGEEIGMPNGEKPDDPAKRTPMAWDATPNGGFTTGKPWKSLVPNKQANVASQTNAPNSLLSWYRKLIRLRIKYPALQYGKLEELTLDGKESETVVAFIRQTEHQRVLVVMQLADSPIQGLKIPLPYLVSNSVNLFQEGNVSTTIKQASAHPKTSEMYIDLSANAVIALELH
jgi:glycosidase